MLQKVCSLCFVYFESVFQVNQESGTERELYRMRNLFWCLVQAENKQ